jgi:hypothetical protein
MEKVIIYLIIGVGYLIFNFYKKLNVPKEPTKTPPPRPQGQQQPRNTPQQEQQKSIEDILKELTREDDDVFTKPEEKPITQEEFIDTPPPRYESVERGYEDIERKNRIEEQEALLRKAEKAEKKAQKKSQYEIGQISDFRYDEEVKKKKKLQFNLKEAVKQRAILDRPKHFE